MSWASVMQPAAKVQRWFMLLNETSSTLGQMTEISHSYVHRCYYFLGKKQLFCVVQLVRPVEWSLQFQERSGAVCVESRFG